MILILAGTGEARRFAGFCAKAKISAMASLAGATKNPIVPSIKTVSGGFGQIIIGDENSAMYKMHYAPSDFGIGINIPMPKHHIA